MPQFVVLWTDALIFLLLFMAVGFGFYAARKEHLRDPWRNVVESKVGVGTMVVLLFYVAIGLLDSIHFHPTLPQQDQSEGVTHAPEVISLFDQIVTPLRVRQEKTYSAPLATRLYAKETIELPDGIQIRDFPRLLYGGAHLKDPEQEWLSDILRTIAIGTIKGLVLTVVVINLLIMFSSINSECGFGGQAKRVLLGQTAIPWRVVIVTLAAILIVLAVSAELSLKYHLLGTDKVGEDVFYQALKSIRTGLSELR